MAVAVLSPWPTTPTALTAAVACLRAEIGDDGTDDRIKALGSAAGALVERHAPGAPQAVRNEAVIRTVGWLREAPADGVRRMSAGPFDVSYSTAMVSALRHSGAMAVLAPWRVRRAGVIA